MRPWQIIALVLMCGSILIFSVIMLKSDTRVVERETKATTRVLVQKGIAVKGKDGLRGGRGPIGKRGPKGDRGPRGAKGAKGNTGARGPRGSKGPRGADGSPLTKADLEAYCAEHTCRGPQGDPGKDGRNGADGRDGVDGAQGVPGPPSPMVPCAMLAPELGYQCAPVVPPPPIP